VIDDADLAGLAEIGERAPAVVVSRATDVPSRLLEGVRMLFVKAPIRVSHAVPAVEDLFLGAGAEIDSETASRFVGLVNLRIESQRRVSLDWFPLDRMQGLAFRETALTGREALERTKLIRAAIHWHGMSLSLLPESLRWLSIVVWSSLGERMLAPIWGLEGLQYLSLGNIELKNLRSARALRDLRQLRVTAKALSGVAECENLQVLHVSQRGTCPPVAELGELKHLKELEIRAKRPPGDLAKVSECRSLERLVLSFGDIHVLAPLGSMSFITAMTKLRELKLTGVEVRGADLTCLRDMPNLKSVEIVGTVDHDARRLASDGSVRAHLSFVDVSSPAESPTGEVLVRNIEGRWSIFQDVSELLGLSNNHEAEVAIKKRLMGDAPGVIENLEFDSEGDSFSVDSSSQDDIRTVARAIGAMAAETHRGTRKKAPRPQARVSRQKRP